MSTNIIWFKDLGKNDVGIVGGKNASLGEMISKLTKAGIRVPDGFATTAEAFRRFLTYNNLEYRINDALNNLDIEDVNALQKQGAEIRQCIIDSPFPVGFCTHGSSSPEYQIKSVGHFFQKHV